MTEAEILDMVKRRLEAITQPTDPYGDTWGYAERTEQCERLLVDVGIARLRLADRTRTAPMVGETGLPGAPLVHR